MNFGLPLGDPLVQVHVQISLLEHLPDDVRVADRLHLEVVALSQLLILDALLPQ